MAIQTKQWCGWGGTDGAGTDFGRVSYQWDDTVAAGFPNGKLTAFTWVNDTPITELVSLVLRPGNTGADIPAGTVTSIPLAAGSQVPMPVGTPIQFVPFGMTPGVTFTVRTAVKVGDTSIAVTSASNPSLIPAGSTVYAPFPTITIPPQGQTAPLPPAYGGGSVGSSGSVNLAPQNVPMITVTSHGQNFPAVPADLICVD